MRVISANLLSLSFKASPGNGYELFCQSAKMEKIHSLFLQTAVNVIHTKSCGTTLRMDRALFEECLRAFM